MGMKKNDADAFFQVSSKIMKMSALSAREKLVYVALCSFADNKTGECFPGVRTIAKLMHLHHMNVEKALVQLEVMGIITIDRHFGTANYYTLLDHRKKNKKNNIVNFK